MVRSIPPRTSTGRSRSVRGPGGKSVKLPGIEIRIGSGLLERRAKARQQEEKVESIRSWTFVSEPKFTRYRGAGEDQHVLVERIKEPMVRLLEDIAEVVVVAYLPGVEEKDIHIELHGDILEIAAEAKHESGVQRYAREMLLPLVADPSGVESSFENDILEIKLQGKSKRGGHERKDSHRGR